MYSSVKMIKHKVVICTVVLRRFPKNSKYTKQDYIGK